MNFILNQLTVWGEIMMRYKNSGVISPGIIDPHVHMGLFVPFEEDLKSETKSAALGGITTVGCFIGG